MHGTCLTRSGPRQAHGCVESLNFEFYGLSKTRREVWDVWPYLDWSVFGTLEQERLQEFTEEL